MWNLIKRCKEYYTNKPLEKRKERIKELILERELGYQFVGIGSAEVSLYLPGSLAWDGEL